MPLLPYCSTRLSPTSTLHAVPASSDVLAWRAESRPQLALKPHKVSFVHIYEVRVLRSIYICTVDGFLTLPPFDWRDGELLKAVPRDVDPLLLEFLEFLFDRDLFHINAAKRPKGREGLATVVWEGRYLLGATREILFFHQSKHI